MRARPFCGMNKYTSRFEVFMSAKPGHRLAFKYTHTCGPFRSKAGADYFAKWGWNNIRYCRSVADAERLAKVLEELYDVNTT
jgi:selenocysteine lyase/cysteine desulfurase